MRILVQRVLKARVEVEDSEVGSIDLGLLVFVGVRKEDTKENALRLASKLVELRIFSDEHGKSNLSLLDVKGKVLIVSQFTLYADCMSGRRPSFVKAALPECAKALYELFVEEVKSLGVIVETGVFGAKMCVSIENDGPFTVLLEN